MFVLNGHFYTRDALSVWTNLGKHLWFGWLYYASLVYKDELKTNSPSRRTIFRDAQLKIIRPDRIMRLLPVFILETHNQTSPSSSRLCA